MAAKLASLTGWQLAVALLVIGVGSYFAISTVLHVAAAFIPLVSALGAVAVVVWLLLAGQREPSESQ